MKKIAALIGAGALLLAVAGPTFATGWFWGGSRDTAIVFNSAASSANTGGNVQGNGVIVTGGEEVEEVDVTGNNTMITGDATSYAGALVVANTHVECCPTVNTCGGGCQSPRCPCPHEDFAMVANDALSVADTGRNGQGNFVDVERNGDEVEEVTVGGNNSLRTGVAVSEARAWTIVNTHLSW